MMARPHVSSYISNVERNLSKAMDTAMIIPIGPITHPRKTIEPVKRLK